MFVQLVQEVRAIVEERFNRLKKRAITVAAASVLIGLALLFALLAVFVFLQEEVGAGAAALILFVVLMVAGAATLLLGREKKPAQARRELQKSAVALQKSAEDAGLSSTGWPLIITAFMAGLALARGRFNGRKNSRER
jgi:Kef-type K+ transport system membrane component KefB